MFSGYDYNIMDQMLHGDVIDNMAYYSGGYQNIYFPGQYYYPSMGITGLGSLDNDTFQSSDIRKKDTRFWKNTLVLAGIIGSSLLGLKLYIKKSKIPLSNIFNFSNNKP